MKGFIFAEQLFDGDVIATDWEVNGLTKTEYARVQKVSMDDVECFVYLINSTGMEWRRTYDRKDSVEIVE